jgi:alpha-glucosidase
VVGKAKTIHSHYEEAAIPLISTIANTIKQINFVVRVFNDGVAFRYEFPQQKNWERYTLTDELTTFNLARIQKC